LTVDALNMVLIAVLVFLILRQVMPIAAGLAGGLALSSFGLLSRTINWSLHEGRMAAKKAREYVRAPRRTQRTARLAVPADIGVDEVSGA
jgi:hypothetical protein